MDQLLIRATRMAQEEPSPEDVIIIADRDSTLSWERLVRRSLHLISAVKLYRIMTTELAELAGQSGPKMNKDQGAGKPMVMVTKHEVTTRQVLKPSKGTKAECGFNPLTCQHAEIKARGYHTYWFTCTQCGTRWPRAANEKLSDQ